jgi:hypothetical protein
MQHHHLGCYVVCLAVLHSPQQMLRAVAADAERERAQVAEVALPHSRHAIASPAEAVPAAVLAAPRLGDAIALCEQCSSSPRMTLGWVSTSDCLESIHAGPCVHCCVFGDTQKKAVRL